ncbi:MAG: V-type ATPase subunit [Spirochaetaceae bacterium]|jgi:vacuolar-type H+-ATPase subunit C/Vma6|nr:V-type ATPase subunit [Spirochaetaceae bacterium]
MIGAGERAYAYAKACGIIGKSYLGRRIAALHPVSRLSELDRLVFGMEAKELPERELLPDLERRFSRRSVSAITAILNSYKNPPELLILLIQVYEYADLKTALTLIAEGEITAKPAFTPLGRFGTVHFEAWPDPKAMLAGTDFEFLLKRYFNKAGSAEKLSDENEGISLEAALDRHYYSRLWASLKKLKKKDRRAAEKITAEEISLRNCAWVLRLRTYYGMKDYEVKQHLIDIKETPGLCADALAALEFSLDNHSEWEKWKRFRFLNPGSFSGSWQADPRYFQNAASEYLYRLALHNFRLQPSSIDTIFCFIKLKQFEEDLLTSNAEGLSMGMSGREVLTMLETAL